MRKFPKSVTRFFPTEDDVLSGSPLHKRVRIEIVAEVDIPLDATVQGASIITDSGMEISPVLGLWNTTTDKTTANESQFRNFAVSELEYLHTEILEVVEDCDECDGDGEKAYGQDGGPYEPCRKCKGSGQRGTNGV